MKKFILAISALMLSTILSAQKDTLTTKEMELLKTFGGLIKNITGDALKENGFGNAKDGLVGGALKNILKKTTEKSIGQLGVPGGFKNNPKAIIQLPDKLKKLEGNFKQFGKKQLLDNLVQSMNETASDVLSGIAPMIAGKLVDMAVDRIISNANADEATMTGAFEKMFRSDLKMEVLPLVEKGLKVYKTTKTLSKINKLIKRKKLGSLNLDLNDYVSNEMIDGLFGLMKDEEMKLRNSPTNLINKALDLLKN